MRSNFMVYKSMDEYRYTNGVKHNIYYLYVFKTHLDSIT